MTDFGHGSNNRAEGWIDRIKAAGIVLFAAAAVLLGLAGARQLSFGMAFVAWVVVAAAALVSTKTRKDEASDARREVRSVGPFDRATLDAIVTSLPDPTIVITGEDRVVAFNSAALDVAPALERGAVATLMIRGPEMIEALRRARATGLRQQARFVLRAPLERWFEAFVVPVGGGGEAAAFLALTFHDLTPLRRIEEMRVDFVANASHELRTPLATLAGFIETLQGPARDDVAARQRFLSIMKGQADRMARLIEDLLSLSRVELNEHLRPSDTVDLASVLRQVVDALQPLAQERGVTVEVTAPATPLRALGDRDELLRVFENLVENALKYGASGKRVEVNASAESNDGEAMVQVRDYGPGIAPEHLPRLTERFYRADVAASRAEGGTGLGLALVKHIVNRHRGRLHIASAPGEGATFRVWIPLIEGSAQPSQAAMSASPPSS